ncbi:MAG: hypothetical protein LBS57_08615 [Treponema sp.]|jgi:hypothetical protein|nr:hypothetical protein [Treponema sp.]
MGLRGLAESDLAETLEDAAGAGSPFVLIDPQGREFELTGTFWDIGYLLDMETGLPVQGRAIAATYRIKSLADKTAAFPGKGWRIRTRDLNGADYTLFVVGYEPDRTIGIGRLKLAASYGE